MPEPLSTDPSASPVEPGTSAAAAPERAPSASGDTPPSLDPDAAALLAGMLASVVAPPTISDPVALLDLDADALREWLSARPDARIALGDKSVEYERLVRAMDHRKWQEVARLLDEFRASPDDASTGDSVPTSGAPEPHSVYAAQCRVLADRVLRARHRAGRAERRLDSTREQRDSAAARVAALREQLAAAQAESTLADGAFRKDERALAAAYEERRLTTEALTTYIDRAAPILEAADADPAAAVERLNAVLPPAPAPGGDSPAGTGNPLPPALARDLQVLTIGELVDLQTAANRVDGGFDRSTRDQLRRAFGRLEQLGYIERPAHGKYRRVR